MSTKRPPDAPLQPTFEGRYDVVVIGGGPAGATVAALVAKEGHRVLVLDRSQFPRFHVGESLIPETYGTLSRLGLIDALRQSAFPKKYSVQFVADSGKVSEPFYFDEHNPGQSSQTWQVVRSDFDKLLLDNASAHGATVRTDAQVLDAVFDGERAAGVRVKTGNDQDSDTPRTIEASAVVDATGQSAFLASRLGLKEPDHRLRKGTIWSYFRGAQRDSGRDEGATIILQTPGKKSWFWYIPLPDDVVSVGCTGSMHYIFGKDRSTPEETFNCEVERCPALRDRLEGSERTADFFTTKDFSYYSKRGAGPGWVLIGDAFGFIDPVYSSGVFLALKSGEFAADALIEALQHGDFSESRLGGWQLDYSKGIEQFRKLVYAFYTPGFSFGKFLQDHPRFQRHLTDILIGDVFKPEIGEMFEAMGDVIPPSDLEPHVACESDE